jgi:hypothetical protein
LPRFCGAGSVSRTVQDCLTIQTNCTRVFVSLAFPPRLIQPHLILSTRSSAFERILASPIRRRVYSHHKLRFAPEIDVLRVRIDEYHHFLSVCGAVSRIPSDGSRIHSQVCGVMRVVYAAALLGG